MLTRLQGTAAVAGLLVLAKAGFGEAAQAGGTRSLLVHCSVAVPEQFDLSIVTSRPAHTPCLTPLLSAAVRSADVIIGSHGATMANAFFARPGTASEWCFWQSFPARLPDCPIARLRLAKALAVHISRWLQRHRGPACASDTSDSVSHAKARQTVPPAARSGGDVFRGLDMAGAPHLAGPGPAGPAAVVGPDRGGGQWAPRVGESSSILAMLVSGHMQHALYESVGLLAVAAVHYCNNITLTAGQSSLHHALWSPG